MDSAHDSDRENSPDENRPDGERSACRFFRDALIEHGDASAMQTHAAECAQCTLYARRFAQRSNLLSRMTRKSAPHELEGRVVAALEAGARQQRAIEALLGLGRLKPPAELDGAVMAAAGGDSAPASRGRPAAPAVLERLVSEEISDPPKARARRFVGSLRRFVAPRVLDQRVSRDLVTARPRDARPQRVVAWIGLAAVGLIALATPLIIERALQQPEKRYPFRVERIDATGSIETPRHGSEVLGSLGPTARQLLDSVGGGILSANQI